MWKIIIRNKDIILLSVILTSLIMIINFLLLYKIKDNMGQYGDIFGLSTAFFTGIALCFLIYGIHLQREEIKIAKEDLSRTKDILDEQSKYIKYQEFNNHFFSLLKILSDYIMNAESELPNGKIIKGNIAINNIKNKIFRVAQRRDSSIRIFNMEENDIEKIYLNIEDENIKNGIHQEAKKIYQIMNMIIYITHFLSDNDLNSDNRIEKYFDILKTSITDDLRNILCVYIKIVDLSGYKDLEEIMKKYNLLKWP